MSKTKMLPKFGASYTYLSGNKNANATKQDSWDQMFYDQNYGNIATTLIAFSDLTIINVKACFKPMDDVTLSVLYGYFNMARAKSDPFWTYNSANRYDGTNRYINGSAVRQGKSHIGDEIDATITYDYTEDVQFGLTAGVFIPGKVWAMESKNATQVIGSMKVVF
jgi:hypothetical protein